METSLVGLFSKIMSLKSVMALLEKKIKKPKNVLNHYETSGKKVKN